jgi:hypothetical protein
LDVIFIKSTFDIFDHETCFSDCRVSDHAYFDDDTTPKEKEVSLNSITESSYIAADNDVTRVFKEACRMKRRGRYLFFFVGLACSLVPIAPVAVAI